MHQAIPYRSSWRADLHNTITTPHPLNTTAPTHSLHHNNRNNKNSSVSLINRAMVLDMVSENAVIVIGRRGCCMSHVVKRLLLGLGVNPAVHEVEEGDEEGVARELEELIISAGNSINGKLQGGGGVNDKVQFPAVFIGGKLFGGLERLMATHISGELVPTLKQAGALWL